MANFKLIVYKIVLQEFCEQFRGTEEYIKEKIEELCDEKDYQEKK